MGQLAEGVADMKLASKLSPEDRREKLSRHVLKRTAF